MKKKNLLSLVLTLVMVFSMTMTAFASESGVARNQEINVNVTIDEALNGHTFEAFQIFSGTQTGVENDLALGDVEWGDALKGGAGDEFLKTLKAQELEEGKPTELAEALKDCDDAKAVAEKLSGNDALAELFAQAAYDYFKKNNITGIEINSGTETIPAGYYLIEDVTKKIDGEDVTTHAFNAALLQVTGNDLHIAAKTAAPSAEKKVQENVKYNKDDGYGNHYNDVADYNIGDNVPFAFYSAVPNMEHYETYYYAFHDMLDPGLTFNDDVTVVIGDQPLVKDDDYTVIKESDQSFVIEIKDLKVICEKYELKAKDKISVTFTAKLNKDAIVGLPGNMNTMYLEYSNNPNESTKGKTPEDKVIVFTYELDVTKVDGEKDEDGNRVNQSGLKDAQFELYRISDAGTEYVIVDENSKVAEWTTDEKKASTLKSDENGLFKVSGLDDGTYYLKETKAPAGYNLLKDPIPVEVKATTVNGQKWEDGIADNALTGLKVGLKNEDTEQPGDVEKGIVNVTVENNKGVTLPETGGIGTTIFTVSGVILVIIAGVLLVTKKRMSKEQ